jgi:hypothetical protein
MEAYKDDIVAHAWRRGNLEYKLDALQRSIRATVGESTSDKICVLSSRQIGKSYWVTAYAIEYCLKNPGTIVRILAPTLKQVSDIVQDNLNPICLDAPHGLISRSKSEYRWQVGNSSLRLGALERSHVDLNRGGNASLVIFEEGGFVSSDDYKYAVESVISPQLLRSKGREIHITSPSEDETHYIHDVVSPRCDALGTLFRYTVYDSPSITHEMIAKAIERCGGIDTESFRREYMAEIVRSKSLMVVPEFDESIHVGEFDLPEHYNPCISLDMGGSRDKTAILTCVWDFKAAKLLIWNEALLDPNTSTQSVVQAAQNIEQGMNWYGKQPMRWVDAPGQVQVDMVTLYNYPIILALKDDPDAQINALRLLFNQGKVLVHRRCKHLIGCLKTARYNNKRTDFERSELYGHADPIMALVYGMRMIDRTTNPYPPEIKSRDHTFYVPGRDPKTREMNELAKAFGGGYNPRKRAV